ncbi:flagellar basal body rod protein FlgB [Erythrobacteraceae bacterium CFH 75059]|uniref:flagellar basal body rod protein FlgB n=1 Tax=Qipengyuania thermophila TaxID=2509361 RepID=UPI001022894B|nr:flagellar basal body rod protein FlgB [Qipengyuania thermophila]TCD06292.1 flagellar basal body rod protein FlgB [Erythrobacteraceae bacterium CFH 75059]
MTQDWLGIHGAALELRSRRLSLLTANLANAATPGYRARDLDFAAALQLHERGATVSSAGVAATRYRVPLMPSADGNTVDATTEQLAFAQNAVAYSATLAFVQGRVETLTRALRGE